MQPKCLTVGEYLFHQLHGVSQGHLDSVYGGFVEIRNLLYLKTKCREEKGKSCNIVITVWKLCIYGNVKIIGPQVNFLESGLLECPGLLSFPGPSKLCWGFLFTYLSPIPDCELNEGRDCDLFSLFSASSVAQHMVGMHWINEHGNKQIDQLINKSIDKNNVITHQKPYLALPTYLQHFLAFPSFPSLAPCLNPLVHDTTQPLSLCTNALD